MIPADQISTDDFAGSLSNQTNLAIKGIIGIKAMAVVSGLLGDSARESNYSVSLQTEKTSGGIVIKLIFILKIIFQSIASDYVTQWQGFAVASSGDHLTLSVSCPTMEYLPHGFFLIFFSMEMIQGFIRASCVYTELY